MGNTRLSFCHTDLKLFSDPIRKNILIRENSMIRGVFLPRFLFSSFFIFQFLNCSVNAHTLNTGEFQDIVHEIAGDFLVGYDG